MSQISYILNSDIKMGYVANVDATSHTQWLKWVATDSESNEVCEL